MPVILAVLLWILSAIFLVSAVSVSWEFAEAAYRKANQNWVIQDGEPKFIGIRTSLPDYAFHIPSAWAAIGCLCAAGGWFSLRRRFSLRTLLAFVLVTGILSAIPQCLRPDTVSLTFRVSPPIPSSQQISPPDLLTATEPHSEELWKRIGIDPSTVRMQSWGRVSSQEADDASVFRLRVGLESVSDSEVKQVLPELLSSIAIVNLVSDPESRKQAIQQQITWIRTLSPATDLMPWARAYYRLFLLKQERQMLEDRKREVQEKGDHAEELASIDAQLNDVSAQIALTEAVIERLLCGDD